MRTGVARLVVCAYASSVMVAAFPSRARADAPPAPTDEARAHYSKGVRLYNEGSYDAARVELERANQLAPSYRISYSIGLVQLRLNDFVGAKASFEKYLADGGANVPGPRKTEVNGRLKELAERIATVDVAVSAEGAQVYVDDLPIGTAPLATPILLNPGYHKITATKAGYNGDAKQLGLASGDNVHVQLALVAIAAAPEIAPAPAPIATAAPSHQDALPPETTPAPVLSPPMPAPADEARGVRREVWIGWTVTGVLAVGAVATGIAALHQSSKLTDEVERQPTAGTDIASTRQRTVTLALVTDVLAGAAVAAGGISLYFTLISKKPAAAAARSDLGLDLGLGRVQLRGRF